MLDILQSEQFRSNVLAGIKHTLVSRFERLMGTNFPGTAEYWDRRYVFGGNSGSGSYGNLAEFKARFINGFIEEHRISSVIEFGCGDGNQLSLMRYPTYVGIDVSKAVIEHCRKRFSGDFTKEFCLSTAWKGRRRFELSLSMDVIFHLVEDRIYQDYMANLFESSSKFVVIYSSNLPESKFEESYPGVQSPHVHHRRFTDWIERYRPNWSLCRTIENPFPFDPGRPDVTSFAQFYVFKCSL